jgi:hypothetical protein
VVVIGLVTLPEISFVLLWLGVTSVHGSTTMLLKNVTTFRVFVRPTVPGAHWVASV